MCMVCLCVFLNASIHQVVFLGSVGEEKSFPEKTLICVMLAPAIAGSSPANAGNAPANAGSAPATAGIFPQIWWLVNCAMTCIVGMYQWHKREIWLFMQSCTK